MGISLGYWITLFQSTSFKSINSFFLACFALIALIGVFEQNIRDQLSQVKFMSWMSVGDKCIEISLITRSHRLSPSWLTLPYGYSNVQNPAVNCGPGASSVSCESWSSRTGGRDLCLSPRPECSLLGSRSAAARGLGSLCQLVLWQTLSLDHTNPLLFVIEIIEADILLSKICHPWSLTMLSIRYQRHHLHCQRTLQAHMACFSCWLPSLRTACDGAFDWQARPCHFAEVKHKYILTHIFIPLKCVGTLSHVLFHLTTIHNKWIP